MAFVEFKDVKKVYHMGEVDIHALRDVNFEIEEGEFCVIVGASGAGKTTILNILGGMDTLSEGKVILDGKEISAYNQKQLTSYRRYDIGFVFQFYNLIPMLTARENVAIAARLSENPMDVDDVIEAVGLKERKNLFPSNLSGGEMQRLSIARALVKKPEILLCDEPTGALDSETGKHILQLLKQTADENKLALVIVTHNGSIEKIADKVIKLKDGHVAESYTNKMPQPVMEVMW